eukprot:4964462-Prorocentrum_lima.AAC.1
MPKTQVFEMLLHAQRQLCGEADENLKVQTHELHDFVKAWEEQQAAKRTRKVRVLRERKLSPEEEAFERRREELSHL